MTLEDILEQVGQDFELVAKLYNYNHFSKEEFLASLTDTPFEELNLSIIGTPESRIYDRFLTNVLFYLIARDRGIDAALTWKLSN